MTPCIRCTVRTTDKHTQQKDLGKVNGYIEEMMEGQKVVKVFTHEHPGTKTKPR